MSENLTAARRLYDAFAAHDGPGILGALSADFVGDVSAGMPLGVGGVHHGPEAMLREVWGPVFAAYDMRVEAEDLLASGTDRVVAVGHYRGTIRASGTAMEARFAHVLTIGGDRISRLVQITDTASWAAAS